jgi:ribosomal protein L11 methyltransferase
MPWQQLKVQIHTTDLELLEQQLLDQGALSISYLDAEDQPVFQTEPGSTPLWDSTVLICLFDESTSLEQTIQWLNNHPSTVSNTRVEREILADKEWERSWMDNFSAMQFGNRLWICPSWQTPPDPNAVNIMLDPGLAFGTGTHATTSLCLSWLDQTEVTGKRVIDYGCGSGVLAIAAALLDAAEVHAVDNDPQALEATTDNTQRNGLSADDILCYLPDQLPAMQADILLANILAEPLRQLAPLFSQLVKPGGTVVLSGLLADQAESLLSLYRNWFDMELPVVESEWVRLTGSRKQGRRGLI